MPFTPSPELAAAVAAVRDAARICRRVQARLTDHDAVNKPDLSPVSVADFASQAAVCHHLARAFPRDPVVGEEESDTLRSPVGAALLDSVVHEAARVIPAADTTLVLDLIDRGGAPGDGDRHWTLDPIDGTKGFLRKEQYAIALALIENGRVTCGVLGCPNLPTAGGVEMTPPLGLLLAAELGKGTWALPLEAHDMSHPPAQPRPVSVSDVRELAHARVCESVEAGHSSHHDAVRVAQLLGVRADPARIDSQAKYAAVARGDASIYLRLPTKPGFRECIWDHAAGVICVEEAGGEVSDVAGRPLDFSHGRRLERNRGVIATNGIIHAAVVDAVAKVLGDRAHRD